MSAGSTEHASISVVCYAGYRGEQEPRRFFLGQEPITVVEIIDRWISPGHRYFKCRGSDGDIYILRQDVAKDRWEMTMYVKA